MNNFEEREIMKASTGMIEITQSIIEKNKKKISYMEKQLIEMERLINKML